MVQSPRSTQLNVATPLRNTLVSDLWVSDTRGARGQFSLPFPVTAGLSLVMHVTILWLFWATAAEPNAPSPLRPAQDIWAGTTVSVIETPPVLRAEPQQNEASADVDQRSAAPQAQAASHRAPPVSTVRKMRATERETSAAPMTEKAETAERPLRKPAQPPASQPNPAAATTGIDLMQAMRSSLAQPSNESGTFGAAGVDLRERRLPKALTRALPVAMGTEPGWWKQPTGALGTVHFSVSLSDAGKIEDVVIEEETKHPLHARVVRRVVKLLALGTFALVPSPSGSTEQHYEMRLVMERVAPDSNSTADSGDLVEKGFEAPVPPKPGQAIIRDAPGHVMRAFLKWLPEKATD